MISIIIQGPLVSQGFNCIQNIDFLIDAFLGIDSVDKIILTTWQQNESFSKQRPGLVYLQHELPTFYDSGNRYKQFFSTYKACQYVLNNLDSKYVLKVRTDMHIDA